MIEILFYHSIDIILTLAVYKTNLIINNSKLFGAHIKENNWRQIK